MTLRRLAPGVSTGFILRFQELGESNCVDTVDATMTKATVLRRKPDQNRTISLSGTKTLTEIRGREAGDNDLSSYCYNIIPRI